MTTYSLQTQRTTP